MKEILDVIHKTIYQFFDVCGDDEEVPMSDKNKLLLKVNKAICNNLKTLQQKPSDMRDAIPEEQKSVNDYIKSISTSTGVKFDDAISRQAVLDLIADYDLSMGQVVKGIHALPPVTPQAKDSKMIAQGEPCEYYALCRHGRDENKLRANLGACDYCNEDSNGYVKPIEKNSHAFVRFGMNGWELSMKANGWHGSAKIRYCPMCGRDLFVK